MSLLRLFRPTLSSERSTEDRRPRLMHRSGLHRGKNVSKVIIAIALIHYENTNIQLTINTQHHHQKCSTSKHSKANLHVKAKTSSCEYFVSQTRNTRCSSAPETKCQKSNNLCIHEIQMYTSTAAAHNAGPPEGLCSGALLRKNFLAAHTHGHFNTRITH